MKVIRKNRPLLPKGVATLLPDAAARLRRIESTVLSLFHQWGYQHVITPIFEYLDVLSLSVGEDLLDRAFKFVDRSSGRVMVLRPDVTPQIARMASSILLRQTPLPLRLCYSANVFRHEEEHAGREREIFQMGIECIGIPGVEGDAEMVTIAIEALQRLGVKDFKIAIGHMGFFRGLLEELDGDTVFAKKVLNIVARKEQAELDRLLFRVKISQQYRKALVSLPDLFGGEEILSEALSFSRRPSCRAAIRQMKGIFKILKETGYDSLLLVDLGEVRRFDYYTGMVFEMFVEGMGYELGGGGRYDRLLEQFGHSLPSTGFALHIERLQSVLDKNGPTEVYFSADLLLTYVSQRRGAALKLARVLREKGFRVICHLDTKGTERQIADAKRVQPRYLAIFHDRGPSNQLSWFDLRSNKSMRIKAEKIGEILSRATQ